MKPASDLSELEGCVLGVIARFEPCTTYKVRKAFGDSLTTGWRASAGAIYPLIDNLVSAGLVGTAAVAGDKRGSRKLSLTDAGRAALARWVSDPSPELGEPVPDPIRTRFHFLADAGLASTDLVESWIERTEAAAERATQRIAEFAAQDEWIEAEAYRAALRQLEARLAWLRSLDGA